MTTTTTERRSRLGFRGRVLGSFVALVAGAVLAGLIVQRFVALDRFDQRTDEMLDQEREELQVLSAGVDPTTGDPFGADVAAIFDTFLARNVPHEGEMFVTFVDGRFYKTTPGPLRLDEDAEFASRVANLSATEWGRRDTTAGPVRYLAVPLQYDGVTSGVFVVASFTRAEREEIESTIRTGAVVSVVTLVVAAVIAWFVAGRLLRPVRDLTAAAESITDTDLDTRIPVHGNDEIARLTRRFNEMLDRLTASFAAQRAFVDNAGHELRTPITVVRGHLELMGDDPDERRETVALVTDELGRMSRIVEDLLDLANSEQPDFVQPETTEVAELTTELLMKARTLGDRTWLLDECATGEIALDRHRITQAMLNLARNAHEHTGPEAAVWIGSAWSDEGLRIWVRDDGPGIAAEDHERIFGRFARGRGLRRSEGAGLGLAIVKSVAEAHHGRVELYSEPGRGSTFTLVIPGRRIAAPPWPAPATSDTTPEREDVPT